MGKINFNVLMVEDNNGDAKLVSEMLKGYIPVSFKMSRTNCLEKTLKILKEEKFDIILLDLDLPDSHGLVTLGKIISMNYRIPIIVLTGFDDDDTGIKAMQMQAEDYLIKGYIDTNLLVRSIRYSIERKSVKEKLELSKQQYKSLAENVPSILIRYDKNLHIKYLSPKAETITGIPSNKFIGKANKEMGISEYLCVLWDNAIKDVFKIEHRKSLEFDFPSKNGLKTFYMTLSPEFSLKGIIDYVLCVLTDITERKHAEEILKRDVEIFERLVNERSQELAETLIELEKTKRLSEIGTLAATIAHELRNPLNTIQMAVYNIKRKIQDPSVERSINNIENKILESEQIINNLLFYSNIRPPNYKNINFYKILNECVSDLKKEPGKNIPIKKEFESVKDTFIEADPFQIKEVFINLLNNAYDSVFQPDGLIEIKTFDDNNKSLKVCIKDNGTGISKENLGKVFDPFFSTKSKGTGLGLSVCRQIIDLHAGSINIESEQGKGTEVSVTLPKRKSC